MFDIFKKIFKRPKGDAAAQESPEHTLQPAVALDTGPEAESALTPPPSALASGTATTAPVGPVVNLPIKSIIPRLPDHVRMKVNLVGAANATVNIPVEKILEQLPHGSVHFSIDDLKQFAPPQVFAQVDGQDQLMIELPLAEILSRLDPALLKRKSEQKRIEVPGAVTDLFDKHGQALPQAAATP